MSSAPSIETATTPGRTPAARPTASPPHALALTVSNTATSFPCGKPNAPSRPSVRWASDPGETLSRAADDVGKRRRSPGPPHRLVSRLPPPNRARPRRAGTATAPIPRSATGTGGWCARPAARTTSTSSSPAPGAEDRRRALKLSPNVQPLHIRCQKGWRFASRAEPQATDRR